MSEAPDIRLRDAEEKDIATIADIYNESILAGDATMDGVAKTPQDILGWMRGFTKRELILLLEAFDGDRWITVGWGIIKRYSDRHGYRFCCETAVYLRRDQTGRGYGTRMKIALIERCKSLRYHHLVAKIFADNEASIRYNQKLGYEIVGTQREIGWKNDAWKDVTILQLVLDDVPAEIPEELLDS